MRSLKPSILAAMLALVAAIATAAPATMPTGAEAREARLLAKLNPQARSWIKQEARREVAANTVSHAVAAQAVASAGPGINLAGMSVEDAVMLMMMEISRDAEKDMREMLAEMDQTRTKKQAMRDAAEKQKSAKAAMNVQMRRDVGASQPRLRVARSPELDAYLANQQAGKDAYSDMGEMEQMKLQALMDRRAKAFEMISNMMKKASETQGNVIKNMK